MSTLARLCGDPRGSVPLIIGSTVTATLAILTLIRLALTSSPQRKTIPSPRETLLPKLSKEEQDKLFYPPNILPGARDVGSPYGTIRVYEFGPENGRKVLLLHGITTPCLSLASLASSLVEKGCRVLLLDLFGRGYSDSPDLPHDSRLYSTEILLAITSSPLPWTPEGFSVIGRSLGGAIAVDFAASFPHMVKSLVLLAPAGLIRPSHFGWVGSFKDSVFISDRLLEWAVARRLRGGPIRPNVANEGDEKKGNRDPEYEAAALVESRPDITTAKIVEWQLDYHEGFVRSFVSSIRHSSIGERRETWRKLGKRTDKVLIIGGSRDPVIVAEELREDAIEAIGEEKVVWRVVDGGHDFPITRREEVMEEVCDFWGL